MAANPNYDYHTTEHAASTSPYGSGDPYYNKSSGYMASGPGSRPKRNWLKIAIPVAILVIVGAVVGGVLGSRASRNSNSPGGNNSNGDGNDGNSDGGVKNGLGRFPTATDSFYGMPIYPSTVSLVFFSSIKRRIIVASCPLRCSLIGLLTCCTLCLYRPTPPSTASRRFQPMQMLGPATHSAPEAHPPPAYARIDLDLLLPHSSGTPSRTSLPTIHTSQLGTSLFSTTPPSISTLLLSDTIWTVTVVSLTTLERSR